MVQMPSIVVRWDLYQIIVVQNRTKSSGSGFSLYRKLCNLFNGFWGKFQFNAIQLKQLLILLGQGILRLGQDPA